MSQLNNKFEVECAGVTVTCNCEGLEQAVAAVSGNHNQRRAAIADNKQCLRWLDRIGSVVEAEQEFDATKAPDAAIIEPTRKKLKTSKKKQSQFKKLLRTMNTTDLTFDVVSQLYAAEKHTLKFNEFKGDLLSRQKLHRVAALINKRCVTLGLPQVILTSNVETNSTSGRGFILLSDYAEYLKHLWSCA